MWGDSDEILRMVRRTYVQWENLSKAMKFTYGEENLCTEMKFTYDESIWEMRSLPGKVETALTIFVGIYHFSS